MSHYSDPTAARAMGSINREFSRLEKKAKRLCRLLYDGQITQEEYREACNQFTGIYRHVPKFAWEELQESEARKKADNKNPKG